jgi:hypothetical protein
LDEREHAALLVFSRFVMTDDQRIEVARPVSDAVERGKIDDLKRRIGRERFRRRDEDSSAVIFDRGRICKRLSVAGNDPVVMRLRVRGRREKEQQHARSDVHGGVRNLTV